ncbi:dienelactone hydrolase family protein [Talaromyces proteolyticus]|uniref:Dienelactone hydrolase family protein n=1 Tax=Talaromyces proteolyticus TaxID=1131652 RepID=A0AAD4KWG4_9EURO|nr:dienelactone hydrolase family protein [Talaromyces proteolyticus]KAH8701694.1 dienelactone hydrolase family protein [Talaromyces proteolyticus]
MTGLGACCFTGFKHEGEISGEVKKIGNFSTYFSYPKNNPSPSKAIIILSDIYGIMINSQLVADDFARNGYLAVIPDIVDNEPLQFGDYEAGKVDIPTWLARHGPETVYPNVEATIKHLREELGVKSIGTVGYCFGARFVVRFLKKGQVDAGYTAHPTNIQSDELASIEGPLSIAAAEIDQIWTREARYASEDLLIKTRQPYQINVYGGVHHGFAARADLSNAHLKRSKELAFLQALNWFQYYL